MDIVIGIGNELRGDDGVGASVVDRVPARPALRTMTVHQLVPELAEEIHSASRVLFVDAWLNGSDVRLSRVEPAPHRGLGHACSPDALLEWTRTAFGAAPESWLLSVAGSSFEPGEMLSPATEALVPEALDRIKKWLDEKTSDSLEMEEEA